MKAVFRVSLRLVEPFVIVGLLSSVALLPARASGADPVASPCVAADCNGDGQLSAGEMTLHLSIILRVAQLSACPGVDLNHDGRFTAGELTRILSCSSPILEDTGLLSRGYATTGH